MFPNISADWWRHLAGQLLGALFLALIHTLQGTDWSSFGVYSTAIPAGIALVVEIINQVFPTLSPAVVAKLSRAGVKLALGFVAWSFVGASVLSLSACDFTVPTVAAVTTVTDSFISEVQAEASKLCGFVPDALTIANIFDLGGLTDAVTIATDVCTAIAPLVASHKRGLTLHKGVASNPSFNGVVISGYFIK